MRQLGRPYLQHARRHLPQGSDPIPGLGGNALGAFATLYLSHTLHGDSYYNVPGGPAEVSFPHQLTSDSSVFTVGSTEITVLKAGVYIVQASISFLVALDAVMTIGDYISMAIGGTAGPLYGRNVSYPGDWLTDVDASEPAAAPSGFKDFLILPVTPTNIVGPALTLSIEVQTSVAGMQLDDASLNVAFIPCYS